MPKNDRQMGELIALIIRQCVSDGDAVNLTGVGTFDEDELENLRFVADSAPTIFIAYVQEDADMAVRLYDDLVGAGIRPWIDKHRLMPGQNWPRAIQRAIESADFFVGCFSATAVRKRGQFPHELRLALKCADQMPLDDRFILPVRLDACTMPRHIDAIQHVDLFPEWERGVGCLVESVWVEFGKRMGRY
ncbi:MAG: toll/interleukin-1 receptor domain-containing protein [Bryobacteraceae bacterium]|nr:toll/interleukin-1 receptor domain-containing protein [Bryobacteraceae bacterium]